MNASLPGSTYLPDEHSSLDTSIALDARDARETDAPDTSSDTLDAGVVTLPDVLSQAPTRSTLDLPVRDVWPAVNRWNDGMEREFRDFVASLGRAVAARQCGRLDRCLRDPSINTLYDAAVDGRLALTIDCADLPYILRAYFAFKRRLPFGFVAGVRGVGTDERYMTRMRPTRWKTWTEFRTPRQLLSDMTNIVHSGMYRFAPEIETADFYPVVVSRDSIAPGTLYYDPNGHVLVVIEVRDDGTAYLMDGHPDGSLTYKRFGAAFAIGTRRLGGGFKRFRPMVWDGQVLTRTTHESLSDYDDHAQWNPDVWHPAPSVLSGDAGVDAQVDAAPADAMTARARRRAKPRGFHDWVRDTLAQSGVVRDPLADFRDQVQGLCRDTMDRADAVRLGLQSGLQNRPHPPALPWNIYGTTGEWETHSSPSRDARLKASFRELYEFAQTFSDDASTLAAFQRIWQEETARAECQVTYTTTRGDAITLTLDTVLDRIFLMSFDPYHCVELRWGAALGSAERAGCPDDRTKLEWYRVEQRLRNQVDRAYGVATSLESGPLQAPALDVRVMWSTTR